MFGRAASLLRQFKILSLFSYRIYISILKKLSVKQPYSDSASSDTIVLCNSGSVCKCYALRIHKTRK